MTRIRVATVLAVVATLAVLATAAVAGTAYLRRDDARAPSGGEPAAAPLVVRERSSGATFEVPGDGGWSVRSWGARMYYADEQGRPGAVVRGPAVFRAGYCTQLPRGSNRGFAGFTRQDFGTWVDALVTSVGSKGVWTTGVDHEPVELADGTTARLSRSAVFLGDGGPCAASGAEIAMVEAGTVRLVLVWDTGEPGTLRREDAEAILTSLRLR